MNPSVKKFLIPIVMVNSLFTVAILLWFIHLRFRSPLGKADMQVELRHPESKLTEIDLVNNGTAAGPIRVSIDISWPDADMVDAKGLSHYNETDTSRRSMRFFPQTSAPVPTLGPGETCAVGWVKLTDDVPVHAEIVSDSGGTTQP